MSNPTSPEGLAEFSGQTNQDLGTPPPTLKEDTSLSSFSHTRRRFLRGSVGLAAAIVAESYIKPLSIVFAQGEDDPTLISAVPGGVEAGMLEAQPITALSFEQKVALERIERPIYEQFLDAEGILIKAPKSVDLRTLELAKAKALQRLIHRPDIKSRMIQNNASIAIIPQNGFLTDLPEYTPLENDIGPDGRPFKTLRGLGGTLPNGPTAIGEERLLWFLEGKSAADAFNHEFAHAIQILGFTPEENQELQAIYEEDMGTGRAQFAGSHGTSSWIEYWARLADLYHRAVGRYLQGDSVEDVRQNTPRGYRLLEAVFGSPAPPTPYNPYKP